MSEQVLNELQLLTAMYDPNEIQFHDQEVKDLVDNCIPITDSVSLSVRLNEFLELDIRLPLGYPEKERLSAHCRISKKGPTSKISRNDVHQWESEFNHELNQNYLSMQKKIGSVHGESLSEEQLEQDEYPNILGVIQWCNEHCEAFPVPSEKNDNFCTSNNSTSHKKSVNSDPDTSCRIWIFSHHIYNKNKRKFLVNTADELDLSGFSLPGKPGFICVEGNPQNCDDYWSRVRQLCWQKISLIERQTFPSSEIIFDKKPFEELHCDKSAFIKFLEEKNSSSIIKDYLGI